MNQSVSDCDSVLYYTGLTFDTVLTAEIILRTKFRTTSQQLLSVIAKRGPAWR